MSYSLVPAPSDQLPRLAWIASIPKTPGAVRVLHGVAVEQQARGIVEGCWDGDFSAGAFAEHVNFFGSGLTVEPDRVTAASSRSLTDRIVWCEGASAYLCSNSLPLLLSFAHARLRRDVDYAPILGSCLKGIRDYTSDLPLQGEVSDCKQVFGHNVVFEGPSVRRSYRQAGAVNLSDFGAYRDALHDRIDRLVANCRDTARSTPVSIDTTLSTGYDSAAVTALLRDYGLNRVFTTRPDETAPDLEDGASLALSLGLDPFLLERKTPSPDTELFSLAGAIDGRESIFTTALEHMIEDEGIAAVFTGYHGDKLWDIATPPESWSPDIIRGDTSGLNLCESRLRSGFFNIGVPFIFADRIEDLVRLAQSPEMQAWSVAGDYDRPIPRRIAEAAGLERDSFGQKKKVVLSYEALPLNAQLREEFTRYFTGALGRLKFYANVFSGDFDYAVKLISAKLRLPVALPPVRKRLKAGLFANQIYIFAVNTIAERYDGALADACARTLTTFHHD
ncbi:MAG: hypothetical protein V2I24_08860 [Halieaceae bacterium]|jgi:hypothetical protein|nr:hypothetical protein [Halieaceae bacterium]